MPDHQTRVARSGLAAGYQFPCPKPVAKLVLAEPDARKPLTDMHIDDLAKKLLAWAARRVASKK